MIAALRCAVLPFELLAFRHGRGRRGWLPHRAPSFRFVSVQAPEGVNATKGFTMTLPPQICPTTARHDAMRPLRGQPVFFAALAVRLNSGLATGNRVSEVEMLE
jgi:hypothetical protein